MLLMWIPDSDNTRFFIAIRNNLKLLDMSGGIEQSTCIFFFQFYSHGEMLIKFNAWIINMSSKDWIVLIFFQGEPLWLLLIINVTDYLIFKIVLPPLGLYV